MTTYMPSDIHFSKLSGSGNDFICIDNRDGRYDPLLADPEWTGPFIRRLCHRGVGVGADGVIFACRSEIEEVADISARFLEADGSECELCGNGTGCFIHWVVGRDFVPDRQIRILTPAGVILGQRLEDGYVRVCIPTPENSQSDIRAEVDGRCFQCDLTVVGVPHAVTYVDDIETIEVSHWGPRLRHHDVFQPRGANINFVQVLGKGEIANRTFEFGVEGETLACGTGSSAAAVITAHRFGWDQEITTGQKPVLVRARSGDVLRVYFTLDDDGNASDVCLETIVRDIYEGRLNPALVSCLLEPGASTS